eukprot:TRINITY_DN7368_c0_g1_i2.p1 TRINITY_DN7368_c0_g1~~TRINITY_DN7368_c0_g1_i2.p1  ORF type:complete len:345 (-),score=92.37 TRINITY_DN7368_c0_g1_i2:176-1210(-)
MPTDSKPTTPKKGKKGKVEPKVEEEVVEEVEVEEVVEDAEEVVPGQEHSLAFKSLTDRDIRELAECGDAETTIRLLSKKVKYPNYERSVRDCIMLEFHYFNFIFAQENAFNRTQTSAFFSIMHTVATSAQEGKSLQDVYSEFKQLMVQHSFHNPPESCKLFSLTDVRSMTEFATRTFFQHFKLYRHVFNHEQESIRSHTEVFLQTSMPFSPLEEFVPEEEWEAQLQAQQQQLEQQQALETAAAEQRDAESAARELEEMAKADAESKAAGLIADAAKGDTDAQVQLVLKTVLERQVGEMRSTMELKLQQQEDKLAQTLAAQQADPKAAGKGGKDKGGRPKSRGDK